MTYWMHHTRCKSTPRSTCDTPTISSYCWWQWMENHFLDPIWVFQVASDARGAHQCPSWFLKVHEWHLCQYDWHLCSCVPERYSGVVTFHNTHSIFADIIRAEIFKPNLSNSIPAPSHSFVCFRALPMILTFSGTFSPCSTCFPSTLPPITLFNNFRSYCV